MGKLLQSINVGLSLTYVKGKAVKRFAYNGLKGKLPETESLEPA
jgi:hypothetical protein